jgi:hypothetical protein
MLEETSNISAYRVISMSDRKALESSLNGISPFKRGEGSTNMSSLSPFPFPLFTPRATKLMDRSRVNMAANSINSDRLVLTMVAGSLSLGING